MQLVRVRLSEEINKGCEEAPVLILNEMKNLRSLDFGSLNLEEIHVDLNNLEEAHHLIFENGKEIFEKNDKAFFIGGDNSVNKSLIPAFDKIINNAFIVVFDAHTNCLEGEWISDLVDSGLSGRRIILVGCRNVGYKEKEFIKKEGISVIGTEILREDINLACDAIMEKARNSGGFFISFNMNVLDPAFAPGVCDLESGGISSEDAFYFCRRLSLVKNFKGGGIFGVNPLRDFNNISVKLAARILGDLMVKI